MNEAEVVAQRVVLVVLLKALQHVYPAIAAGVAGGLRSAAAEAGPEVATEIEKLRSALLPPPEDDPAAVP
jgi:hypothetical protein